MSSLRPARHRAAPTIRLGASEMTKLGASRFDLRDPYYMAVTLRWPAFFLAFLAVELVLNIVFALLYAAMPGCIANAAPGSVVDAFFFSVETLATVGYGVMAPATLYGHIISSLEIMAGMTVTALFTGLIFVRFSRPKARILFAEKAVVTGYNGKPTLMIRLGNGRLNMLADANATLMALVMEQSIEGHLTRATYDLKLRRSVMALFPLTWTLAHEIDQDSPLNGLTAEDLATQHIQLFLAVVALDHAVGAQVRGIKDYQPTDILFGARYLDAVTTDEDGRSTADLRRLSLTEPDRPMATQ